ncbi:MAG: TIGR02099 family protein [Rhodocyclaceae bacterium]|nr:TIGR02099 family protein [Rhodocyclaceae bacterium]
MKQAPHAELRELRPALYHRFHFLLPLVAHPVARRLWAAAGWLLIFFWFAFSALILVLRYSVLPDIEQYRERLERAASENLGLPVHIGSITAGWQGLQPDLALNDVRVDGIDGRPAIAFSRVEAILDWSSLVHMQLRLALLAIDEPVLHLRRDARGGITVAGITVSTESEDTSVGDWVLAQKRLRINGATLVWEDELRAAPPLILEDVNLALDNRGRRHRFGFTALPPADLAARIDIRGDLVGDDFSNIDGWQGQLFAELDYIDLAVWRQWIDYPFALPRGRGAMRTWVRLAEGKLLDLTADLALEDVRLQLARTLPELRLTTLQGRLGGRLRSGGFAASARGLSLGLADGTQVPPTDFSVDWQTAADGRSVQGSGTASRLNLQRLASLSRYLPLDAATRKRLDDYAPAGEIADLRLSFSGNDERLETYSLRARFDELGLRAQGYFPGFYGISGTLEATDKGGNVSLRSQRSGLDLPSVFPEPRLAFDSLSAQVRWKIDDEKIDVDLQRIEFAGEDAAGSARGSYRLTGEGPGSIDLTANLVRARGDAVWRYMPHAVNANARTWLRRGITTGNASDAKLTLKGDLARFPFIDGSGTFLVTAKAHDVTIDYAPGWPVIEHIDGDLRFAGAGMRVDARSGTLFGTRISETVAEIPDFDADNQMLMVRGRVAGPVGEFFRFIEASPVGDSLEHATSDMSGSGAGELELALQIPLADTDATRVEGTFHFLDSQVVVDPALPPLTGVKGSLHFTDGSISVRDIGGQFLGGPVKVRAETRNGLVDVLATGALSAVQARRYYDLPLFDSLSGTAAWRASVKVRKSSANVVIDSDLVGMASKLPAPFGKSAGEALPVRVEKGLLPGNGRRPARADERDRIQWSLGKLATGQLIRQRDAQGHWVPERGALAVGGPLSLPEKGLAMTLNLPQVDVDYWRAALTPSSGKAASGAEALAPNLVQLATGELTVFGRKLHDVDLRARLSGGSWQMALVSRESSGDLQFDPFGRGALRARLKTLELAGHAAEEESAAKGGVPASAVSAVNKEIEIEDLPALDVVAESFVLGKRKLGRLEVQARNEAANWRIEKLSLVNPEGRLEGHGHWRMLAPRRFEIDFKLGADDAGGLLGRMGYPGTLKGGKATLDGKLSWAGSPVNLDFPSLDGNMRIDAANGQFAKIDPGAAGKLLGLISLQGLPRRITLDFKDVFSEGFAFDSIAGRIDVKAGLMHTDRLQIDGPSARILMRGDVDLQNETQKLVVNIQPELGGTAALGVAIINPIAGAATLLAHKVLQNPLNQIFSFDYSITGKWDDPKVDKISTQRLGAQTASEGEKSDARP